ncbi:ankyrin repeat domain-containing protein 26 isoform X2 [Castor canadensis]|uniref:Ankyrin repeat domain-containing protein 26 isoform X2 n=1 Tax=Castor canadensis TaxID=51338 RepID=A0AC58L5X3_CASCN
MFQREGVATRKLCRDGLTPFMLALKENQQEVAEFLLAEGANSHGVYKMRSSKILPECAERRSKVSPNDPAEANIIVASEKEQKVINGSEKKLKVKEEKKHESNEMEGPRTLCHSAAAGAAGATVDAELILPRPKSRAANQQFPTAQSEEHDSDLRRGQSKDQPTLRSRHSLPMEKGKKNEHERWNSTEPGTSQMFLNANSLPDHSVHVKYDCTLNEIELDEGRPAKKVPHEKSKVKKQVTFMDDPTNLIESYETVSENSELFDAKKCLCEFEHLDTECTADSEKLLIFLNAIHSYKRYVEVNTRQCDLLIEKNMNIDSVVSQLQKELSESRQSNSQLELDEVDCNMDLWYLRCALEEEKKRKALNAKDKEEQDNKKGEQYNKKLAMKKQSEICLSLADTELNSSAESSSESECEELSQLIKPILFLHNEVKKQKEKDRLSEKETARCKHVKQTVEGHTEENENGEFSSEEDVKASQSGKNSQCEKEIEINRLRQTLADITEKLQYSLSEYQQLVKKNEQKSPFLQTTEKRIEAIVQKQMAIEEVIKDIRSEMDKNMVHKAVAKQYKREIEERVKRKLVKQLKEVDQFLQPSQEYCKARIDQ